MSQTDPVPVLYSETTEDPGQPDGSTAAEEEVNVNQVCISAASYTSTPRGSGTNEITIWWYSPCESSDIFACHS